MSAVPPYARPPIVEAVLDVQVELPAGTSLSDLQRCQRKVKKNYPSQKTVQHFSGEFTLGTSVTTSTSSEVTGYVFSSSDGTQLFQAKRTGYTHNQLAPYLGWDKFVGEAKRLWEEYRRILQPKRITRLALRFINRFDFSFTPVNLETYFRTYLEVSRDLPQNLGGFFIQFFLPIPEIRSTAGITKTHIESGEPGGTSILLDLDLFRTEGIPSNGDFWPIFDELRLWKNKVFEASITEDTRELIR